MDEIMENEKETAYLLLEEFMAMARSNKEPNVELFSLNGLGEKV